MAGLTDDAVDFIQQRGPLKGRVTGRMSSDGRRGWRLDWDDKKGFHVNWWDQTGGTSERTGCTAPTRLKVAPKTICSRSSSISRHDRRPMERRRSRGQHLDAWMGSGRGLLVPVAVSAAFGDYLDALPWMASSLDWRRMPPSTEIDLSEASEATITKWLKGTSLARHSHLVAWYESEEEGMAIETTDGIQNLDTLFWGAPGTRFAFGANLTGNTWVPVFADLLEYRGADIVTATLPRDRAVD